MSFKNQGKSMAQKSISHSTGDARAGPNSSALVANIAACATESFWLRSAAQTASTVFTTIEKVQANKEDYEIIAKDASDLIIAIWQQGEKSKNLKMSPEVRAMVQDLTKSLNKVNVIAKRQSKRGIFNRVIFYLVDAGKIRQTQQKINTAVTKFQVLSHIKLHDLVLEAKKNQDQLSKPTRDRDEVDSEGEGRERSDSEHSEEEETSSEEESSEEEPIRPTISRPATRSSVGRQHSASITGISITNHGPGTVYNRNMGNIVNSN